MKFQFDDCEFSLWDSKYEKDLFLVTVSGSHRFGWVKSDSDLDVKLVWIPDLMQALSVKYKGKNKHKRTEISNNKILCLESKPIVNFFYELTKGNGNNLEWLFMPPLHQKPEAVEEIKKLTIDNLHKGFLGHYLGYYSKSLKKDMDNPSRLKKYGLEKLLLCSYRVLRTGIILGQTKQVIYNVQEQDKFGFGDCCNDILSYYLNDKKLSEEQMNREV